VFLLVERTGVQTPGVTESGELPVGQDLLQGLSSGVTQNLNNVSIDGDTRLANAEELVDERTSSNENNSKNPRPEGARGDAWVIVVVDDSTNFSIRGVDRNESGLNFEFLKDVLILNGIVL